MIRIGIFLALIGVSVSCKSDETSQRKREDRWPPLTRKELEGKTFAGRLHKKAVDEQKNSSVAKAFEQAKLVYQFRANNQVLYNINLGGMTNQFAFTWRLKGDSLSFERIEQGQLKTNRYLIQRTSAGFTLDNEQYRMQLTLN